MNSFINLRTGNNLKPNDNYLVDNITNERVALISNDIPRFVRDHQNYANNFGYQWNKWNSILSDSRNENADGAKFKMLIKRTRFDCFDTKNKTILECGCGGGDDTEILLQLPFSEVHSFDLSTSIDRAGSFLKDPRLVLSQASIFEIPYADQSFDFVYCHRVLQHTPDPERALRTLAKKVKPGGVLFIHSYHASLQHLMHFKYKYRFLTKRIPHKYVEVFLQKAGPTMYKINRLLYKRRLTKWFAYNFIPFTYGKRFANFSDEQMLELEKLITFDALTPRYDKPMRWKTLKRIVEDEGFEIAYYNDNPKGSPIYLTARRKI